MEPSYFLQYLKDRAKVTLFEFSKKKKKLK